MTSATTAYRCDVAAGRARENDADGGWLPVAGLLEQAAVAPLDAARALSQAAATAAVKTLGTEYLREQSHAEWGRGSASEPEILYLFILAIEKAQLIALADSVAATVARIEVFPELDRRRVEGLRARLLRKLGNIDFAEAAYQRLWREGTRMRSAELKARAALGFTSLAQQKGNIPHMLVQARRAVRLARTAGLRRVEHEGLMSVVAASATRGQFGVAIEAAWAMLACSIKDYAQESKDLATLGQLLLEMGRPESAVKVLARIFYHPSPPEVFVAALGSLAIAASRSDNTTLLDWSIDQIDALRTAAVPRFQYASTLLDAAVALAHAARGASARRYRDAAVRLATKHGFHEFVIRAETLDTMASDAPRAVPTVGRAAAGVLRSIDGWAAKPLPRRARMAGPLTAR